MNLLWQTAHVRISRDFLRGLRISRPQLLLLSTHAFVALLYSLGHVEKKEAVCRSSFNVIVTLCVSYLVVHCQLVLLSHCISATLVVHCRAAHSCQLTLLSRSITAA